MVRFLAIGVLALAPITHAQPPVARLPDWFEGHRVQLHIEQSLETTLQLTPKGLAEADRSLGASVATHLIKTLGEGACWPTKAGTVNPLTGSRDLATEMVQAHHAAGVRLIGYYRHMCDDAMQAEHPDWICRDPDGKPVYEPRTSRIKPRPSVYVLCLNSPYREHVKTRLLELAERGLEAIYFDSWHIPPICTCEYCRKAFRQEMGHDMKPASPPGSPDYTEAVEFVNRSMVRAFTEWHQAVRAKYPRVFFAVSSSMYPVFASPHIDERLLAISDTSKTEFHKPFGGEPGFAKNEVDFAKPAFDDQLALGWSLVRDASGGRPPLMWVPFLASEKTATYSAAAAMTYGCIASLHGQLGRGETDMERNHSRFNSVFALGDRVSPHLAHARPLPLAAVHISEKARNARLGDPRRMWHEVFSPSLGACQILRESHVPWVVLTDGLLASGPAVETRLLILPWPDELTPPQRDAVAAWERGGGTVIRLDPKAGWGRQSLKPGLVQSLGRDVQQHASDWPIRINGPAPMHAMCFRRPGEKRYVICLANTWAWFHSSRDPEPGYAEQPEPPACEGVTIAFSSVLGRPRKVLNAVTSTNLDIDAVEGAARVRVPSFQVFACIVVEY